MQKFIRQNNSHKWSKFNHKEDQFILTFADMDLPLYDSFKKSIVQRLSNINNFTYKIRSDDYFKAIVNWYKKRHVKQQKFAIVDKDITQTPSVLNIIFILLNSLGRQNDGVLLLTPIYNYYDKICKHLKRKIVECQLYAQKEGNQIRYNINFTDLQQKAKHCKFMIFCNPHNPSGRIWTKKQVEKIISICQKNNILIISDEILCDLIPQHKLQRFYSLVNSSYQKIVVCNSISKTFNAMSLRGGFAIIKHQPLRNQYQTVLSNLSLNNNQFSLICTEIFYSKDGENWISYALSIIKQNYQYLLQKIKGTLLLVSELEAAYIITINFEGYLKFIERWFYHSKKEVDKKNMVSYYLQKQGIKGIEMIYSSQYGVLTDIRFTIAVQTDYFKKFADKLRRSLLELQFQFKQIDAKL